MRSQSYADVDFSAHDLHQTIAYFRRVRAADKRLIRTLNEAAGHPTARTGAPSYTSERRYDPDLGKGEPSYTSRRLVPFPDTD
jgi:hypothetical protein